MHYYYTNIVHFSNGFYRSHALLFGHLFFVVTLEEAYSIARCTIANIVGIATVTLTCEDLVVACCEHQVVRQLRFTQTEIVREALITNVPRRVAAQTIVHEVSRTPL